MGALALVPFGGTRGELPEYKLVHFCEKVLIFFGLFYPLLVSFMDYVKIIEHAQKAQLTLGEMRLIYRLKGSLRTADSEEEKRVQAKLDLELLTLERDLARTDRLIQKHARV